MSHPELGKKILDHVAETVGDVAKVEAALDGEADAGRSADPRPPRAASPLGRGRAAGGGPHEIAPSGLISSPRAISRCDSTGRVANMRSTIMRT